MILQRENRYKILKIFFDDPLPKGIGFQLREISRKVNIAPTSVKNYLLELEKEKLIIKTKHRIYGYPVYYANRDNENFKFYKKVDNILMIQESGFLEYLLTECMPNVIILFGSASRGEDLKESDIDIFLECEKTKLSLKRYEKILNRKVNLFFGKFNKLSKELKNNILNGTILKGYLKVF
mgnify:CR=1 FL=1